MNPRGGVAAFAEWIHHAAAITITAQTGGPLLTAAYLIAYVTPAYIVRGPRWLKWLSPVAWVTVALVPAAPATLVAAGIAAGIGRGAAHRPGAWLCGLEDSGGIWAVLGAAAGMVLLTTSIEATLISAAVLLAISLPGSLVPGGPSGVMAPAALGACIVIGMRVLEPVLLVDPMGGAVFSLAWVSGASVGARWGRRPDVRPVAAAPFLAAASIALMGSVEGPGMLLLWGATGACTVMVSTASWRTGRKMSSVALGAVVAGASIATAGLFELLPSALWFAAVCLLVGGFVSLAMLTRASRKPAPVLAAEGPSLAGPQAPPPAIVEDVGAGSPEPPGAPTSDVEAVARELLHALRQSRTIRTAAIAEVRRSIDPFHDLKGQATDALGTLADTMQRVKAKLQVSST